MISVALHAHFSSLGFLPGSYRAPNRYTLIPNSEAFVQIVFGYPHNNWCGVFADRAGDLTVPWTGKQEYVYNDDRRRAINPTQKPLRLLVDMVQSLPTCEMVIDLYAGTGSTSVAAALMEK
jgi:DNA modification methylase